MNKSTKTWIKMMDWFSKYWGCHQMPERSFFINGYQFPVCARCTGIIIGYVMGFILCAIQIHMRNYICIALIFLMGIDGTVQLFTKYNSNNFKRFITGILAGVGFVCIIVNGIRYIM